VIELRLLVKWARYKRQPSFDWKTVSPASNHKPATGVSRFRLGCRIQRILVSLKCLARQHVSIHSLHDLRDPARTNFGSSDENGGFGVT
jgi:hypothetical protein